MDPRRRHGLAAVTLALTLVSPAAASEDGERQLPSSALSDDQRILQALNRLGYGPRPGDLERVRHIGLERYIEMQLGPEQIEDAATERALASFTTLRMSPAELLTAYPPNALIRAVAKQLENRWGFSEEQVADLLPEVEELNARAERPEAASGDDAKIRESEKRSERARRWLAGPGRIGVELSQAKLTRAVFSERQLQEVMTDFWFNHFNVFIGKSADRWWTASYEHEAIRPHAMGSFRDLLGAVSRHPAMLIYLDNWLSSAPGAAADQRLMRPYASKAIRAQGLPPGGVATLILRDRGLDTSEMERQIARWERAPNRSARSRGGRSSGGSEQRTPRRAGLNENYARELLELHTLGVDGGYTQDDIVEVARCLTGWTLLPLHAGQQFVFVRELHVAGTRTVLKHKIKGKGVVQGEALLDLLAAHPSTARFISTKLAVRFVADEPPVKLVDRMAATFLETDGDIREVLRTMFYSEEFWSPEVHAAKVKTPFEFVVSALRATESRLESLPGAGSAATGTGSMTSTMGPGAPPGLLRVLRDLGQPLYGAQPPTGYEDTAGAWVSTGALLNRMKIALGIAANRIPGVETPAPEPFAAGARIDEDVERLGARLMGRAPSESTVAAIRQQLELSDEQLADLGVPRHLTRSGEGQAILATGWLLASAEFQRR